MKVKQVSLATKPRGRPPRTKIVIDTEQKKKRQKEQKKIEEQKYEEEKKILEEAFKRFLEEKTAEEEKKREKKKFEEEKMLEEKKKNEKKKFEEEKMLEEKKKNEKKKLEEKKKDDEKKREEKKKDDEKKREEKKKDDVKKREEKKKQILQSSWGTTYGQDNYTRGRSRNRDHYRSEFDRRERSRDYGMRRDNPSRSPSRFRSSERLFQPLSHELEIQQLHAKVRELQHIVAEGKLLQGSKEPVSKQCTDPYPVKSSYEETDLFKLKNRLKYYQKNNSDLKQKLDYANKKIAQMEREQSAYYSNYQIQTDYSQQMQNSSYLNHQNQQEFYY